MSLRIRLKHRNHVPPGGFVWTDPDTGRTMTEGSFNGLFERAVAHRRANNLPQLPDLDDRIDEQTARRLVDQSLTAWVEHKDGTFLPVPSTKSFWMQVTDVVRGTLTIGEHVLREHLSGGGTAKVSQEEAERRAAICVTCPANIDPSDCATCDNRLIQSTVRQVIGTSSTAQDAALKSCRYCGCFNKAQVWFGLGTLQRYMSDSVREQLPQHCWKK